MYFSLKLTMERLYTGIIKQIIKHKNEEIIAYTDDSGIERKTLFFNLKLKGKTRKSAYIEYCEFF